MNTTEPSELVPESFGLLYEYYTPTAIAESMAAMLPELADNVGIGRLIRAFTPRCYPASEAGDQIKKIAGRSVATGGARRKRHAPHHEEEP